MRRIRDKKQVEYWLQKGHIRENFDTENLPFSVCRFEKGEYLTRQGGRLAELLFLIEGEVQIYGIREDGSVTPVNRHEAPALRAYLPRREQRLFAPHCRWSRTAQNSTGT